MSDKETPTIYQAWSKQEEVIIQLSPTTAPAKYILFQLDSEEMSKWMSEMTKRVTTSANGLPMVKDFSGYHSSLVARCIRSVGNDGELSKVPAKVLEKWPSVLMKNLYQKCEVLNGITQAADTQLEDEAKNV